MTGGVALEPAPARGGPGLVGPAIALLRDAWSSRQLIWALAVHDIKSDKRNHVLGNLWHLLNPVINMLIFMFVVVVVFQRHSEDEPYPVFFFCGSIFFRIWTQAISRGTGVLIQQAGLIKSCYFPRIAAVTPVTIKGVYDMLLELLVLAALMAVFRVPPAWSALLLIPFAIVSFLGAQGVVLMLSCLGARFRDLSSIVQHINRVLFYFTPVMYSVTFIPERFRTLYLLNPVASAVELSRDIVYRGGMPDMTLMGAYSAFCVALLVAGMVVFARLQGKVTKFL